MAPRAEERLQRGQFSALLAKPMTRSRAPAAVPDASAADQSPPLLGRGQLQCLINPRVRLLAVAACLGGLAAVGSVLASDTLLHAVTTDADAATAAKSLRSAPRDRSAPLAAGGALDYKAFLAGDGDAFIPVPRLRDDEPHPADAPADIADTPNDKPRRRQRRLSDESDPQFAPHIELGAGGNTTTPADSGNGNDNGNGNGAENGTDENNGSGVVGEAFGGGGEGEGGEICTQLEVVGLENCPEMKWGGVVGRLLAAKADILRQVVEVLTDPASAGQGGRPDEPLLLVQKLMLDEMDVVFGASDSFYARFAPDAAAWSPLPGGFNRWVETYYRKVLRGTRPVLITVHGDDVCALEKELSREARLKPAGGGEEEPSGGGGRRAKARGQPVDDGFNDDGGSLAAGENDLTQPFGQGEEDFDVPVALMTLGWDPAGDPTHNESGLGRDRLCAYRVLEMDRVVRWFTSHTRYDSHTHETFRYLPIGFGGYDTRNGLPHTAYIDAAKRQLEILETCPVNQAGSYDLLFQCNTLARHPREVIWADMTEGKEVGSPIPVNRAPLEATEMVTATARGIFAVSPPGTGPDCFRHYEMMLEGNIALVPDVYSIRQFMDGLPAFFFGGTEEPWGSLTCGRLVEMAETVQAKIKEGKEGGDGLQLEKLTHGFWRQYIRREVLRAGGVTDEDAVYVERSSVPLNPRGWTTFRQVGCFSREDLEVERHGNRHHYHFRHHTRRAFRKGAVAPESPGGPHERQRRLSWPGPEPVRLSGHERTPEGCAAHCATKLGGGVGFFGIGYGSECWCDKAPGGFLPMERCNIECHGEGGGGRCGGVDASAVYVYGPEDRGAPFEYMGCFPATIHAMYHVAVNLGKASTPSMCGALCTSLRYPFFALENSDLCRCGVMPANTPRSDKTPAYIEGAGYEPVPGPPNATLAAKPVPEGVKMGDPRFECHRGRCGGDPKRWGCGAEKAYDLYRNEDPCVLYRDC